MTCEFGYPGGRGVPTYEQTEALIENYGWMLQGVFGDAIHFPFIYTIGNYEVGLPELLVIGTKDAGGVLDDLCEIMRKRKRPFDEGELIKCNIVHPVKVINATSSIVKERFTCQVGFYYGTDQYKVQQILIADKQGRYPDNPKCDVPYSLVPILNIAHMLSHGFEIN